jgi:hypothetical protein
MVSATALTDRVIEVCIFVSSCVAWWSAGGGRRRNARQHSYARRDRPDAARRDDAARTAFILLVDRVSEGQQEPPSAIHDVKE